MSERIPDAVAATASAVGGSVGEVARLPDGSGFAIVSYPLPQGHWLTRQGDNVPPMPLRMKEGPERDRWNEKLRQAARYAIRAATMNGKQMDFDPDALVQCFLVGCTGYCSPDGTSTDAWGNPDPVPPTVTIACAA